MKYILILSAFILFSCEKEYQTIIKYEVGFPQYSGYSLCNQIEVTWEENGKVFKDTVSVGWNRSFNHEKNTEVYLKVRPICANSYAVGYGYVNGNWYYQAEGTNINPGEFSAKP